MVAINKNWGCGFWGHSQPPDPLLTEISQSCEENSLVKPTGRTYVDLFGKVTYALIYGRCV